MHIVTNDNNESILWKLVFERECAFREYNWDICDHISFICNRIDYCNSVLYGASRFQLDRLQSILNAAARIVLRIPKFSHISASIRDELHWLPVRFRPEFKICLFVRNCLVGTAPAYLQELCIAVSSSAGRRSLRSASRGDLVVPRSDTTRFGRRGVFSVAGPAI